MKLIVLFGVPEGSKKGDESKDRRYCDRDLILNLVFDAEVTKFFANPQTSRDERRYEILKLIKLMLLKKSFFIRNIFRL